MLSVPGQKIPRKIAIKIAKAEKLKETVKEGKNKVNNKFKVIVLGGKNKETSSVESSSNGNVQWRFSCIIKLHKVQSDPLALLVEDSDGHHKGQVIIPIVKIPPKPYTQNANQDPANSNNILCSELEPTSKCNTPSGYLLYWIWVEEFFSEEQLTSGKKSFNKSMSSLFASKSKLSASKNNLEINNPDSISNFGSHSTLNKPEKHKKSSSFLNLKIGHKKKSKPSSSDCKITPDSSDADTASNFSFNPTASSNPFDNDSYYLKNDRASHKNIALADENFVKSPSRYSGGSYSIGKQDIRSYGNQDNISEAQFSIQSGDKKKSAAFDSISKVEKNSHPPQQEPKELANGKTLLMMSLTATMKNQSEVTTKATNQFSNGGMVPIIMPPYGNQNSVSSDNNSNYKSHSNSLVSSTLPNKYNTIKELPTHREFNNEPISIPQNENESSYRPGYNKSAVGSDYSIFNQPTQLPNKGHNEESEIIKKENLELKQLVNRLGQQINDLTTELDTVKQTLCRLRLKLLDEGAYKFLEI